MPRPADFAPVVLGWTSARRARTWHVAVRYPDGTGGGIDRTPCGARIDPDCIPSPVSPNAAPDDACRRCARAAATLPKEPRP